MWEWLLFVCCVHAELTSNTLRKMGYISLASILNAIIGITSYCVILKKVILHDAIKTNQNVLKNKYLFFKKPIKWVKKTRKT